MIAHDKSCIYISAKDCSKKIHRHSEAGEESPFSSIFKTGGLSD
jgi:hypothetical protein